MIDLFKLLFSYPLGLFFSYPFDGPKSSGAQIVLCAIMMFLSVAWFLVFLFWGFQSHSSQTPIHCLVECLEALVSFGIFAYAANRIMKKEKQDLKSSLDEGEGK